MSSSNQDVSKMVEIYKKLFLVLAVITALGIGVAFLHMPVWLAIVVAFAIMAVKSKIVIDSFKHLIVGRNVIILLFGLTACFFLTLLLLPYFNHEGYITGTQDISKQVQAEEKPMVEGHHGN